MNFKKKYRDEFGKVRPALIFQTDILNEQIDRLPYKTVAVIPLSSQVMGGHFRVLVDEREGLEVRSEVVVNRICTLDWDKCLTTLNNEELREVEEKVMLFLGYKDNQIIGKG